MFISLRALASALAGRLEPVNSLRDAIPACIPGTFAGSRAAEEPVPTDEKLATGAVESGDGSVPFPNNPLFAMLSRRSASATGSVGNFVLQLHAHSSHLPLPRSNFVSHDDPSVRQERPAN
jgi:hypothetical protein